MATPNFYDTDEEIKSIGAWTWKDTLLWRKIQATTDDCCWLWKGSTGPHANLFGARKAHGTKTRAQMTQVPRLIWMSVYNQDVEHLQVKHSCGNRYCCNPKHMYTEPNHMLYRKDGTARGQDRAVQQPKIKQVQARAVKKQWWQL